MNAWREMVMLDFINRVRKFDPRKLTPMQIIVGAAMVIVGLFVLFKIIQLAFTLLPIALGVLVIYVAYRWLSSRSEDIPEEATKSRNQKMVDEALENVKAAASGLLGSKDEEKEPEAAEAAEVVVVDEMELDTEDEAIAVEEAEEDEHFNLSIEQVVNPETGFKEPDISRLIEREEEKLKEADRVNDDVLSQIEERRRRLLNKNQGE
jgi:membrane protein implicated in regulation of membrane protease activity